MTCAWLRETGYKNIMLGDEQWLRKEHTVTVKALVKVVDALFKDVFKVVDALVKDALLIEVEALDKRRVIVSRRFKGTSSCSEDMTGVVVWVSEKRA